MLDDTQPAAPGARPADPAPAPHGEASMRPPRALAVLLVLSFVTLGIALLADYGPTWDATMGEYPFGHRALTYLSSGDARYLDLEDTTGEPPLRAPHPDFAVRRKPWYQISCLGGLLSGIGCELLWNRWGVLPALEAHNLVNLLLVAWLLWALAAFARRWELGVAGLAAGLLLLASPRFFGHAFNNIKDMPEACLYSLAVLAGYGALRTGRLSTWLACGALTGLAVAQKVNGVFLPIQLGLVFGLAQVGRGRSELRWSWPGFALASVATLATFFAVSPIYWTAPLERAAEFVDFISNVGNSHAANGGPVELSGYALHSVDHVLWTTPPVLLVLGLLGWLRRDIPRGLRALVLLGVLVPIGRTLLPGMRDFDGIRHFLEFAPALALSAGLALEGLLIAIARRGWPFARGPLAAVVLVAALLPGALQVVDTHPHGICYHNSFSGGLSAAQARGLADATDYWGHSYWQALTWIDESLPEGAALLVPVAGHLVESAAPVRLRPDLLLCRQDSTEAIPDDVPLYVMYVTRRNWYPRFLKALDKSEQPVHVVEVQGAPILKVLRLEPGPTAQATVVAWQREMSGRSIGLRLSQWMAEHPKKAAKASELLSRWSLDPAAARAGLEQLMPEEFHADLELIATRRAPRRR